MTCSGSAVCFCFVSVFLFPPGDRPRPTVTLPCRGRSGDPTGRGVSAAFSRALSLAFGTGMAWLGEQGRGFAVVADEVRALANRTKESTDKIGGTLSLLQNYSKLASDSMTSSLEIVSSVIESANKAQEQIAQASSLVEQASAVSINVAAAVEQQATTTDDIAKSAETLRSTVQIDIEKVEILGQESIRISQTANEMENNIARFK